MFLAYTSHNYIKKISDVVFSPCFSKASLTWLGVFVKYCVVDGGNSFSH